MLLLASGAPEAARCDDAGWLPVADQLLREALAAAHPDVVVWTIEPLIGKRQEADLQSAIDVQASVVHLGKRSAVRVTWIAGRRRTRETVWFAATGVQSVPTLVTDVRTGASLGPEMTRPTDRDVLATDCAVLQSPDALSGTRATRPLRADEAICIGDIEPRPPVARGEKVLVRSIAGLVTITAKGIAQQDGVVGQVLRVKNPSSGEVYLAAVSSAGEVVVHD